MGHVGPGQTFYVSGFFGSGLLACRNFGFFRVNKFMQVLLKMGFSILRDSGICAMNNFEFWRSLSCYLLFVFDNK